MLPDVVVELWPLHIYDLHELPHGDVEVDPQLPQDWLVTRAANGKQSDGN